MDTAQFSAKDVDTIKNIIPLPLAKSLLFSLYQEYGEEFELDNIIIEEDDADTYTLANILFLLLKASQTFEFFFNDYEKDIKLALKEGEEHQGEKCTFEIEPDPVDIDATRLGCYRIKCFLEDKKILQEYKRVLKLSDSAMGEITNFLREDIAYFQNKLCKNDVPRDSEADLSNTLKFDFTYEQYYILIILSFVAESRHVLNQNLIGMTPDLICKALKISKFIVKKCPDKYNLWSSTITDCDEILSQLFRSRLLAIDHNNELDKLYTLILYYYYYYYTFDNEGEMIFRTFENYVFTTPANTTRFTNYIKNNLYRVQFCEYYKNYCDCQQKKPCFDIDSILNPILYIDYKRTSEDSKYHVSLLDEKVSKDSVPKYETIYTTLSTLYSILEEKQYFGIDDNRALFIFRLSGLFDQQDSEIDNFRNADKIIWNASPTELALLIYHLFTPKGATGERPKYKKIGDFFVRPDGKEFEDLSGLAISAIKAKKDEKNQSVVKILKAAGFNIE